MELHDPPSAGEGITRIILTVGTAIGDWEGDCYELDLNVEGSASGWGHRRSAVEGHSENHFTAQDFRQLTAELDRLGFFALEEFYTDFRTCHASTSIEVVLGGVTKRVVCEGGIQPDVWPEIIAAFRPALKLAEWREEPA